MRTIILIMFISTTCLAEEVCVVGAGIDNEDDQITYMTGIGANGSVPHLVKPMNNEVRKILESAAKSMDSKTKFCMTGKSISNVFEVSAVKSQKLK